MSFDQYDDIIDSRDVIERIAELRAAWDKATGDDHTDYALTGDDWKAGLSDEEAEELVELEELDRQGRDYAPDWEYGETMIRDTYFVEYAQQLAEDIGAVNLEAGWPNAHIDWEAAAEALLIDYTEIEFRGATYWVR